MSLFLLAVFHAMGMGGAEGADEWWKQPVRMLRVDEAPDFAKLKELDLEQTARSHKEDWGINCEWIEGTFGWDGRGDLTSFETPLFERWPGFDSFDFLRSYTPHAHKYGIHVLSYLNMHWYPNEMGDQHPDWEQMRSDGKAYGRVNPLYGKGTTFCVNGPWRDWAFTMIREAMKTGIDGVFLDGPVVFPDCCHCAICQELFKKKTGQPIPAENWADPFWRQFLEFREESMGRFLDDAGKAMREVNPQGVIFLNGGSWQPGDWRVARDMQATQAYQNFNGAEAFFHHGGSTDRYPSLMAAKYLRAGTNPAVVFSHYMNGSWHYRLLDPCEVQFAIAQTVAGGANPWLALIRSSLNSQPDGPKPVKELFGFLEQNKAYYTDVESAAQVALLFSTTTGRNYVSGFDGLYESVGSGKERNLSVDNSREKIAGLSAQKRACEELMEKSYEGYFEMLARAHIPFDIIIDPDLTSGKLQRYRTLVLPDSACLSPDAARAVAQFVEAGGTLLASFEAGFYDQNGQPTQSLFELLGIEAVEGAFPVSAGDNYLEAMKDHWGFSTGCWIERASHALKVKARGGVETPDQFFEPCDRPYTALKGLSPYSGVLLRTFGKGKVAYFPEAIGAFYGRFRMTTAEQRIGAALRELHGQPQIEVDGAKTMSIDAYRSKDGKRLMVHLVNNTIDGHPVTEFTPILDVKVRVRSDAKPASVHVLREQQSIETSYQDGVVEVRIPKLTLYEVVVVEFA